MKKIVAMQSTCRGLGDLFAQRIDGKHVGPAFSDLHMASHGLPCVLLLTHQLWQVSNNFAKQRACTECRNMTSFALCQQQHMVALS